ncbi:hypothetical protein [Nocardia spumae]|uniref:hypothetical protein n=1 Tax=Nocardia spumae TaxID=2887190 RepID=UPI001D13CAD0|nr:hypothetical protein [Nocardia spumae]
MRLHLPRFHPESTARRELTWDPEAWTPRAIRVRYRTWARATRIRRMATRLFVAALIFAVAWVACGSPARARTSTATERHSASAIDGLSWTDVRDSYGVPLSDYMFATETSILNPKASGLAMVLGMFFAAFMVTVISAIWLTGFVVSFRWLEWLSKPLTAVADSLSGQIATPLMATVSVSIGALFVAWFVLRGYHAKATLQVLTMVLVAMFGTLYLAHPVADVLSPNGLLAKGRDVGISVAAGLTGDSEPNAQSIVGRLNATLADNFARHPVQLWNLGHVVDDSPRCRAAWSSAVRTGSDAQLAREMRGCGDNSAARKIENPSYGQIGTGLVLLVFGAILLMFLAYLAVKIFLAALSSVFHAILAIFGFAAGGFIYGPTQAFLLRNLVEMVGDAASLMAFTLFLGTYDLVFDALFRSAPDNGIAVIFVGGLATSAGFILLKRLDLDMIGGQRRIADRLRAVLEGKPAPAGGGSSGIDEGSLRYALSPGRAAGAALRRAAEFNSNPAASWIFGRSSPLSYYSKHMQEMNYLNYELLRGNVPARAANSWMARLTTGKNMHDSAARTAASGFGGTNPRAAAATMTTVLGLGGDRADAMAALAATRFPVATRRWAAEAHARVMTSAAENQIQYSPLAQTAAALDLAESARDHGGPEQAAHNAQFAESAAMFYRLAPRPGRVRTDAEWERNQLVRDSLRDYRNFEEFSRVVTPERWQRADEDTRRYIGSRLARDLANVSRDYDLNPSDALLAEARRRKNRALNIDLGISGTNIGPWTN